MHRIIKKLTDLNVQNSDKKDSFFLVCNFGTSWCNGNHKQYCKAASKGSTIGMLVDLFNGNIKFFIDNEDMGYMV